MIASLRHFIAAAIAALAVALAGTAAFAHASLNSADPADGAVLAAAPQELRLVFSEPVSPLALRLIGPDGGTRALDRFELRDRTVVIAVPEKLVAGTHVLSWRVVSADGHPVGGSVVFSVGAPSGAPPVVEGVVSEVQALIWLSRTVLYLALFLGCGIAAFRGWVGPVDPTASRVAAGLVCIGLLSLSVALAGQGLDALGADFAAMFQPAVWRAALATSFSWTIWLAAASLVLAVAALRVAGAAGKVVGLLSVGLAASALAASGHASAAQPQWLMRPAVFVHALTITLWAGALLPLALALRRGDSGAALRAFSARIPIVVAGLLLSGLALALVQVERPSALLDTAYGQVLLAKLALVAFAFAIAGLNRWRLTGRVEAGERTAKRLMARIVAVELAVLVLVFATAALWRFTPPPRAILAERAQPAFVHIHTLQAMAEITIAPGRAGPVSVSIMLMTGEFGPLAAREVKLVLANPAAGIEPIERPAARGEDGLWRVEGLSLPVAGRWEVELEILVSDFEMRRLKDFIEIRP